MAGSIRNGVGGAVTRSKAQTEHLRQLYLERVKMIAFAPDRRGEFLRLLLLRDRASNTPPVAPRVNEVDGECAATSRLRSAHPPVNEQKDALRILQEIDNGGIVGEREAPCAGDALGRVDLHRARTSEHNVAVNAQRHI